MSENLKRSGPAKRGQANRKFLLRLHRWMGLNLGLLLFIICFSGTCATLGHEWDLLLGATPETATATAEVDWAAVDRRGLAELGDFGNVLVREEYQALQVYRTHANGQFQRAMVDRHTGEVLEQTSVVTIQAYLRQFHKGLLIPKGLYLV
ncbi:MAG: PepSY-associated TM helix domain-containing protein, partial [Myxococcota bacterium]